MPLTRRRFSSSSFTEPSFAMTTIFVVLLVSYFLPWVVALLRRHRNATAIFILNLLLGWTFIGWVVALVWSFTNS
jgi:hypothetical protein